jgi:hypothetical protein
MGQITEILRETRDWFAEDEHWTQGVFARLSSGAATTPIHPAVVATCLRGGLDRAQWKVTEVCSVACARSVLDQWEHYTRVGQTLDSADNAIQGG